MYELLILACLSSPCTEANDLPPHNVRVNRQFESIDDCQELADLARRVIEAPTGKVVAFKCVVSRAKL